MPHGILISERARDTNLLKNTLQNERRITLSITESRPSPRRSQPAPLMYPPRNTEREQARAEYESMTDEELYYVLETIRYEADQEAKRDYEADKMEILEERGW